MVKTPKPKAKSKKSESWARIQVRRLRYWARRTAIWVVSVLIFWVLLYAVVNPPTTLTMVSERARLGRLDYQWVPIQEVAPVFLRSVVAAEDARFCQHWGFDMVAIRNALDDGSGRGASTISQQTVKNAFLWQGRNWARKALEAVITPLVEIAWTKRRILEVYINIAEFDEGVFGIDAAAHHYFGVGADALGATQSARLAAVLPAPKSRSASRPTNAVRARAAQIVDGAATIRKDIRSACFED